MSNVTATASITSDLGFTLIRGGSNSQNESGGVDFSTALVNGTGSLGINYGVVSSGVIASGGKTYFDFRALSKKMFDLTAIVQFNHIKSILIENREQTSGVDFLVYATGASTGLVQLFNGGSGNIRIKPRGYHAYSDPTGGLVVDASNREIVLDDVDGSGAAFTMVVVGVTG